MQVGRHLRQDEGCKDAAIEGLMKAQEQVGGDRKLGDVDGAHSNPLGSVHAKGHWQRLKTHLPANQQACICQQLLAGHLGDVSDTRCDLLSSAPHERCQNADLSPSMDLKSFTIAMPSPAVE